MTQPPYKRIAARADTPAYLISRLAPPIAWSCLNIYGGHIIGADRVTCARCGTRKPAKPRKGDGWDSAR